MNKLIRIKDFSYLIKINKNIIVDTWLENQIVKDIFLAHQLSLKIEQKKVFIDIFESIMGSMQWELSISDSSTTDKFLNILNESSFSTNDFFTLFTSLKNSIILFFNIEGLLSFKLLKDIENNFLEITKELFIKYEQMNNLEPIPTVDNTNLLNEYKKAVDLSTIVSKTNPKGIITYVNDKFCEISGFKREELIGKPHNIVRHPSMSSNTFQELWSTIKNKKTWNGLITNLKSDGRSYVVNSTVVPILDVDGDIVEFIAIRNDVTDFEQAKEQLSNLNKAMKHKVDELYSMAQTLEQQASIDVLTGVFNRMKFEEFFEFEMQKAKIQRTKLSIILLDIDNFKNINDNFGHDIGDEILKSITKLISLNIRATDTISRWGGEEFAILLPGTYLEKAILVANNIKQIINDHDFSLTPSKTTCSFGVATLNDMDSKESLFKRVDNALYKAKNIGKNIVVGEDELDKDF
ncbi:diguanylate cyclase [Aliarcobacter trophiarum LMG 25534]|uniref:diguanylate cyclase n=1 Tax=Aliarcobacter trophiarum LMG 25534 TaxID=1032241 RepID=A0AAD0QL09_9BACT|nr:diguanylate cyclase [Aliarcobacter trophiarum]AXK49717.1 PAS sensor-containing diguanylate cyclase [Aliarcobacter trophiarum LMG 25534]RXI28041.1 diguanylate cyclase [Aliarcobacter trophiarum]RXJ92505.1 diguanylate cyclase [Aliarcobacter trophiarum LMG 25534]